MDKGIENLPYQGLTSAQAQERVARGQANCMPRSVGKSTLQILCGNFFTLFNLLNLLLALALISVGAYRNLLFLGVVVSNTAIGTIQELRAKRTIDKLMLLSAPAAHIVRDGQAVTLPMEELVLDDLFVVQPGDQLCADAEVVGGQGAVNESLLTGESEPVDKAPGDPLLSGSYVTEGLFYARATKVGGDSYASQLTAKAREIKQPNSELMRSMRLIIRTIGIAILPLGGIQLFKQVFILSRSVHDAVVSTVAAMLGMIPEGLMLLTSVALAVGVVRLGRRKTLVQDLYGIESLARVDTLCLDKTGTLTKGSMAVSGVEPLDGMSETDIAYAMASLVGALDCDNATFAALRAYFTQPPAMRATQTVPFSSARKWSAASFGAGGTYVVGAAEFILGAHTPVAITERIETHARHGERILLLCHSPLPLEGKALPGELAPRALVFLSDILREDAPDTIAFFTEQDVRLKVISGDNPLTVARMAQQAGLPGAEQAIDATTLDTPDKLEHAARAYTVFGRVTPEQKKDLVLALKRQGHTVGMMGDGVNDIPALKASDCAIAMAGGSDAARRVSQLTLLDANFAAVPHIVMEGRRVINNITRASSLFLVKTIYAFLLSLLLVFLPTHYPFAPIQMTLISSLTVGLPSFFLAMAPNAARVKGHFLRNVLRYALPGGLVIVLQILVIKALVGPLGITFAEESTIAVWTTGFSSLVVLLLTCLPLNLIRGLLVAAMTAGFMGGALIFRKVFYLTELRPNLALLTGGLIALSIPLMLLMRLLIRRLWQDKTPK